MAQPVFTQTLANKVQAWLRALETGSVFADLECLSTRGPAAEAAQGAARKAARKRRTASLRTVGMGAPLEVGSAAAAMAARADPEKKCTWGT